MNSIVYYSRQHDVKDHDYHRLLTKFNVRWIEYLGR